MACVRAQGASLCLLLIKSRCCPSQSLKAIAPVACCQWRLEILNADFELPKSGIFSDFASARNSCLKQFCACKIAQTCAECSATFLGSFLLERMQNFPTFLSSRSQFKCTSGLLRIFCCCRHLAHSQPSQRSSSLCSVHTSFTPPPHPGH